MKKLVSRTGALLLCAAGLLAAFGCGKAETKPSGEEKLKVVATLFPQYDFARSIAGDRAQVTLLLPPGVDSHSYDPSMSDLMSMKEADLLIYTGDTMETWASAFITAAGEDCAVLDVSRGISLLSTGEEHEEDSHDQEDEADAHSHNIDPHIWTSPVNAMTICQTISEELCRLDPEGADVYTENTRRLTEELEGLDGAFRECAEQAEGKTLFFGGKFSLLYFTHEYGFSYMSLYDSCSESAEPGVRRMGEMTVAMKEQNARVIFYPELTEPKAAQSIAEQTGAKPLLFHSCHNVSEQDFKAGESYMSLMNRNLENLREALS